MSAVSTKTDIAATQAALKSGKQTSTELTTQLLAEIDKRRDLNAFVQITREQALKQAAASDALLRAGKGRALEGVPISIKANMCAKGIETTAASRVLEGFVPTYTATVVQKIMDAGAVIVGSTNMDEFGMGSSTENSCYGPSKNPIGVALGKPDLSPGGSSGGGAAAVAANLCFASLATDTGGSIRQPASFCGVVGFKPSYGLCSRWGIMAYASSLDQAGVIGKTVRDTATVLDVMIGEDVKDSTSLKPVGTSLVAALDDQVKKKWRVGFPREFRDLVQTPILKSVWEAAEQRVKAMGGELVEVSLPHAKYALPAYYILALSEASSNLARYDGVRYGHRSATASDITDMYEKSRAEGFGRETKKRILLGTFALSAGYYDQYYEKARRIRTLLANDFRAAFKSVDVLVWPTTPTPPFAFNSHSADPLTMYLEDVFTVPVNLAGLPAVSIPILSSPEGLPMGLTVTGPHLGDQAVARVAHEIESAIG